MKRDGIFQIVAEELFRKGNIQEKENKILLKLARFLRLDVETARAIAKVAKTSLSDASPVGESDVALRVYTRVSAALRTPEGPVSGSEQVLHAIRVLFQMPDIRRTTGKVEVPPELRTTGTMQIIAIDTLPVYTALDEAAKLARLEQYDEAFKVAEKVFAVRPVPAGSGDAYRKLLPSLLEEAAAEPSPNRVLPLVKWAARLADIPPEETYRWTVLLDLIGSAGKTLAAGARWDEHALLLTELDKVVDTPGGTLAPAIGRIAYDAIDRCLTGGRYDESRTWHKVLVKQQTYFAQEEVRNRYASALVRQMEYIAGNKDDAREHFTQMHTALSSLVKSYPTDKGLARSYAAASPSIGMIYLKARDAHALKDYSNTATSVIKTFSGDEELALAFARGLVNTAILAKEIGRQMSAEKSAMRRFLDGFKSTPEPFIGEITGAMAAAVASCPHSEAMSNARKRFEGMSGARLLVTEKNKGPKTAPKPLIKASR